MTNGESKNWVKQVNKGKLFFCLFIAMDAILGLDAFGVLQSLACSDDVKSSCISEGRSIPVMPDAPCCCEGLILIRPKDPQLVGSKGICTSKCGDGICDPGSETAYNCPRDCSDPADPFKYRVWDKYDYPVNAHEWEGTDWHNAQIIKKEEGHAYGIYLFRVMKKGRPVYVGWFDCFDERQCSVMKIQSLATLDFGRETKLVKITRALSKQRTENKVSETEIKTARNGEVSIGLQEVPVFVEAEAVADAVTITGRDLKQGWYYGSLAQNKTGTPDDWIHDFEGTRSACWHRPGVQCGHSEQPLTHIREKKCADTGEMCGGIAGIVCCPRLECKLDAAHPDASGTCEKEKRSTTLP